MVENKFFPSVKVEVQGKFLLINDQPPESEFDVEITDKIAWMTDVSDCIFFNDYVKKGSRQEILKGVIVNGLTVRAWRFKCFNKVTIHVKNETMATVGK